MSSSTLRCKEAGPPTQDKAGICPEEAWVCEGFVLPHTKHQVNAGDLQGPGDNLRWHPGGDWWSG